MRSICCAVKRHPGSLFILNFDFLLFLSKLGNPKNSADSCSVRVNAQKGRYSDWNTGLLRAPKEKLNRDSTGRPAAYTL